MSSLQQTITDAKKILSRLKERDCVVDHLINSLEKTKLKISALSQYDENLSRLRPSETQTCRRTNLIVSLQKEDRLINSLKRDNKELQSCLEEYHTVLELIMSKYREQVVRLLLENKKGKDGERKWLDDVAVESRAKSEKISEMAEVMRKAASESESAEVIVQERLGHLVTENRGLRHLLDASNQRLIESCARVNDASTQTEEDEEEKVENGLAEEPPVEQ